MSVILFTNLHDDVIFGCCRLVITVTSKNILILVGINLREKPRESKTLKLDNKFLLEREKLYDIILSHYK